MACKRSNWFNGILEVSELALHFVKLMCLRFCPLTTIFALKWKSIVSKSRNFPKLISYLQSSDKSQFINSRFCKFLQYCNAIETKNSTSLWWLTERVVTFLALLKTPYAKSWSSSVMRISLIKLQSLESLRNLLQTIAIVLRTKWVGKYWNTFNHISSGNNLVDITVWSIPEKKSNRQSHSVEI